MAYDEYQAERIARVFDERKLHIEEQKMFGGMLFKLDGKMCVGTHIDKRTDVSLLMVRIGDDAYAHNANRTGCHPMDYTRRPMKGFAFITPDGCDLDEDLAYWIDLAIAFNPLAKASKKRKKKKK